MNGPAANAVGSSGSLLRRIGKPRPSNVATIGCTNHSARQLHSRRGARVNRSLCCAHASCRAASITPGRRRTSASKKSSHWLAGSASGQDRAAPTLAGQFLPDQRSPFGRGPACTMLQRKSVRGQASRIASARAWVSSLEASSITTSSIGQSVGAAATMAWRQSAMLSCSL